MATILFRTILIYIILIIVMRILGKRQLGELELSELVFTILLSELAVTPIIDKNFPLLNTLIPLTVLVILEILFTFIETRSKIVKKLLSAEPSILINRGRLDRKELSKVRMTVDELISELHLCNISDLNDVYYAILEKNGQLSVFPRKTPETGIMHTLVVDGDIIRKNLIESGRTEAWLLKQLRDLKTTLSETFLFAADDAGNIYFSKKE